MKFIRIFPEIWARTLWPLSRLTLNIAFGSVSVITPSTLMGPCFAISASTLNLPGEDLRFSFSHNDGMFKMRRRFPIECSHCPAVVFHLDPVGACVHHRLNRKGHTFL